MKTKTLNIALPKDLVERVDQVAKSEYRSRSDLIREALRTYLRENEAWQRIFKVSQETAKKFGIKSEEDAYKLANDYRHGK